VPQATRSSQNAGVPLRVDIDQGGGVVHEHIVKGRRWDPSQTDRTASSPDPWQREYDFVATQSASRAEGVPHSAANQS
jgi:hypothetical protein